MCSLGHDWIDLLKVDIEGMEFEVMSEQFIFSLPTSMLAIEFHDRMVNPPSKGLLLRKNVNELMKKAGFSLAFELNSESLYLRTTL